MRSYRDEQSLPPIGRRFYHTPKFFLRLAYKKIKKGRNHLGPWQSKFLFRGYALATSATSTRSTLLIRAALPFRPRK